MSPAHTLSYIKLEAVISGVTTLYLRAIYMLPMALTLMDCVPLDGNVPMTDYQ